MSLHSLMGHVVPKGDLVVQSMGVHSASKLWNQVAVLHMGLHEIMNKKLLLFQL